MLITRRNTAQTKAFAVLMSFLLVVLSFMPFVAGGSKAYAEPEPYQPIPSVTPGYGEGPLSWTSFTTILPDLGSGRVYVPFALDFDEYNNIYTTKISLSGNDSSGYQGKVEMLTEDGELIEDLTSNGAFKAPTAIDVDKYGNIYVSDNSNFVMTSGSNPNDPLPPNTPRILKLEAGKTTWDVISHSELTQYANGVATDSYGNLYVLDSPSFAMSNDPDDPPPLPSRIWKLPYGESTWEDITGSSVPFEKPVDLAVDGEGNIFVSDFPIVGNVTSSKVYKLAVGASSWDDVTPAASTIPDLIKGFYPVFIAKGIYIDKYDNLYATTLFGSVLKLKYNKGANDWESVHNQLTPPLGLFLDVSADNSGYIYGSAIPYLVKLMASVTYNSNGAAGAPPVDLASYKPSVSATVYGNTSMTKQGSEFIGWNTEADGTGTTYVEGDEIPMTHSVTLYAMWSQESTITYSGNGNTAGSVPVDSKKYLPNVTANVYGNTGELVKEGYNFGGWNTKANGTGITYAPGDTISSVTQNITLYAKWNLISLLNITLDNTRYTLERNQTHQTVTTASYSDASTFTLTSGVTYSSSKENVATVNSNGLVTAINDGETVITAVYGGKQATANVTVTTHSDGSTPTQEKTDEIEVIIDGVKQDKLATAQQTKVNDQDVTTITLDSKKVMDKLEKENNKLVTIPVSGNRDVVVGQLNASLVKSMQSKDAQIQIVTDNAIYTLPASQININSISSQVGSGVKLEDITISIQISETPKDKATQVEGAAKQNQFTLVGAPIDFEVTATYGTETVLANKFNSYVERKLALPNGTNASDVTTGVVYTEDGKLIHVPTIVVKENGKTYAIINSLTNSTYSVVYSPREMDDVKGHWAQSDVNDMSSRLIVNGVSSTEFRPDASITRAEFAAIVTRGLGIQDAAYAGSFKDVTNNSWYAGAVQAAINYKLIDGYEDGTFRPDQNISRQEATAVLARAASIAKLQAVLSASEVTRVLSAFKDGSDVASWARTNVAAAISLNLMNGRSEVLEVDANLTRAETAALVRRLLQAAKLINQ